LKLLKGMNVTNRKAEAMPDNDAESRELERYVREKEEEGRRINEGKAHKPATPERRTFQRLEAARAGMRRGERDVPPDAEGQDRAGRIEQTITSDGHTQSR
jgi:hypothetical protein